MNFILTKKIFYRKRITEAEAPPPIKSKLSQTIRRESKQRLKHLNVTNFMMLKVSKDGSKENYSIS
jgi:hypothetical protein